MPRQLITDKVKIESFEIGSNKQFSKKLLTNRELLKRRSSAYLQSISKIDEGNITKTSGFTELMNQIKEEFGTPEILDNMKGIVSKCYLGEDFVVHILDITGEKIIQHFRRNESMSADFEQARSLALHVCYLFVEVYQDKLICVRDDGTAIIV